MSDNHKNTLKTAWNDVTGDTINNSLKSDQNKFDSGWDAIWGNKSKGRTVDEVIESLPEDRQEKIAERAQEIVEDWLQVQEQVVDDRVQLHPYTLCPNTGNQIYQIQDVLSDKTHPAHDAIKEMMEKLEKGELHLS